MSKAYEYFTCALLFCTLYWKCHCSFSYYVIYFRLEGEKVEKAQEWNIPCVNVQWLSELVLGNLRALKLPIDDKYKVFSKPDDFLIEQSMASVVMCE